ncbi:hypothetical protein FDENT_8389 [Fusarium denticulatum]|uniref:Uncharacterized protein n=1 Tax=Fusarium denticulatum TaxID=48507 RepID=A0A8H5X2Z6_9HYPO|nr:hypothetical protein FDENT_8389 [Fusarium denticulatum]
MSNTHYIQVPREGSPAPNIVHQSTAYSERVNAWLREDHKDMPWHNLATIVMSSSNTSEPNPNTNASHNPTTQGSANQASDRSHATLLSSIDIPLEALNAVVDIVAQSPEPERQHKRTQGDLEQ